MGHYVSIPGGSDQSVQIHGSGTVIAGNGNDSIYIGGKGAVTVGAGNDHITLHGSGSIFQYGAGGHDTINLGHGHDTITEAGTATVYGAFGSVTIQSGTYVFTNKGLVSSDSHGKHHDTGNASLVGGSHSTHFVQGGSHDDTGVGGTSHGHHLSDFTSRGVSATNVITNFVSGHDKLHVEGHSLSYLPSHGDVTMSHGTTHISLDGGKTTVELKGFSAHDVTTHKL